ncbi:MAG: D-alanine--D-alanine ligase family protein [Lachnospiraceae bacterium]|nr:D-alanine--D-alanine ligase family protein [Lachnospiraceae bacterium]
MNKKNVMVLFGGNSSEHEVSCMSAQTVIRNIDEERYQITLVGITKEGAWRFVDSIEEIKKDTWRETGKKALLSPDAQTKELLVFTGEGTVISKKIDVIFPVLHGPNGEDGTVQGLFELARIPYVGCGVLASSVSMDKFYTKIIVEHIGGIRQANYVGVHKEELKEMDRVISDVEDTLSYPVFVKPCCAGSSNGVSKASDREGLKKALLLAAGHDSKILVEETITGREVECAVLGNEQAKASGVGEILAAGAEGFYTYDSKYNNAESRTVTDPELPEGVAEKIREAAVRIFTAVSGNGLSRVDFFVENGTDEVVFNEINTMPGFTSISMYPMLWAARGIDTKELVSQLIELCLNRFE